MYSNFLIAIHLGVSVMDISCLRVGSFVCIHFPTQPLEPLDPQWVYLNTSTNRQTRQKFTLGLNLGCEVEASP